MTQQNNIAGKVLYSTLMVTAASVVTVLAWNYCLLGMFQTLPELKVGNVFAIFVATYLVKLMFTNPVLFVMQERLTNIDSNMKTIHHNDTEQRKAIMNVLTHMESNMRLSHSNDVAQRKGILEIMSIINNKFDGEKTETTHEVIETEVQH